MLAPILMVDSSAYADIPDNTLDAKTLVARMTFLNILFFNIMVNYSKCGV